MARICVAADVFCSVQRGLAADRAVHTAIGSRDGTFHDRDVFAGMLAHYTLERIFRLLARASHEQLVVFPGKKIENKFGDRGIAAANIDSELPAQS
jgi:hypothetical protein